jgi:hypothetical protein
MKRNHISALAAVVLLLPGCGLKESSMDPNEKYIVRCARYDVMNNQVIVIDPQSPRVITMDSWPQTVFLAADGEHTVSELIAKIGSQYADGIPDELPDQVRTIVTNLKSEGVIRLSDSPSPLPYYLASPISEQDPNKAKQLMIEDGIIKEKGH